MEAYFISQGLLMPRRSPTYWLGLTSDKSLFPEFNWVSRSIPPPGPKSYSNWPPNLPEPDNFEMCAVANSSLYRDGSWGWSDASCELAMPFICRQDVPFVYNYTSPKTGNKYYMVSNPANGLAAEVNCNVLGGHLVQYSSAMEQQEVEQAFIKQGGLIGAHHGVYWLGLQTQAYPEFHWLDRTALPPSNRTYARWSPGEPGPQTDLNFCATANASNAWGAGASAGTAPWGWQSHDCTQEAVYICEVDRPLTMTFTSNITQNTYMLNTSAADRNQAQESCIGMGGHVVSFTSLEEQREVEGYFTNMGVLLPDFHQRYWLGLYIPMRDPKLWPRFLWLDGQPEPSNPAEPSTNYAHWGVMYLGGWPGRLAPGLALPALVPCASSLQVLHKSRPSGARGLTAGAGS